LPLNSPAQDGASPPRDLRDIFALFPTGVVIVTAVGEDGDHLGATVSSFNSVSLDPPLVLFSMARSAKSFEAWRAARSFAVNILCEDQHGLSSQFARSASDKWLGVTPHMAEGSGLPLIVGALGSLQCRTWAHYDGGDHLIIVGEVFACARAQEGRPLIFSASRYARLAQNA
jgi:flavin reductase (DIM6/NTAB) family NADH-FMN oxidoreductase RutF